MNQRVVCVNDEKFAGLTGVVVGASETGATVRLDSNQMTQHPYLFARWELLEVIRP